MMYQVKTLNTCHYKAYDKMVAYLLQLTWFWEVWLDAVYGLGECAGNHYRICLYHKSEDMIMLPQQI